MVYKIMSRRWFWSQVNLMPAFVVLDPQVPCHQQNQIRLVNTQFHSHQETKQEGNKGLNRSPVTSSSSF